MGVIKLNGKEYGKGGGGGNANIIELTQAEYDDLPESKLTDGILYCITDGDGDVINFVNGVYVNPDNLIVSETNFRSSLSYTATQDCIVCMYLVCPGNSSTYIKIDNKTVQNYWQSQMMTTASAPIYVKKGQTLTVSGVHSAYDSSYWVYGVQIGSVSNAQHNYSTSEQVIGTWVDGKPLYQITYSGLSLVCTNANQSYATNMDWGNIKKVVHSDIIDQYGQSCAGSVVYTGTPTKIAVYMQMANRTVTDITIQYTKTTD